jgi:hypothetical protein
MLLLLILIPAQLVPHTPCSAKEQKFYLRADLGFSLPYLQNLENELARQGTKLDPGYSFSAALGRGISKNTWSIEVSFAASFYPEFIYTNDHEDFPGDLSHYSFAVIGKRNLRPGAESFVPYIGVGLGWGQTNLVSGGGRIDGIEALALGQLETPIKNNISLLIEAVYTFGFTEEIYSSPFLENISSDVVLDSDGRPLSDRYRALDLRIGMLVWLQPKKDEEQQGTQPAGM